MNLLWNQCIDRLQDEIEARDYESLILPLKPIASRENSILVEAPSKNAIGRIQDSYLKTLESTLSKAVGSPMKILLQPPNPVQQELFPQVVEEDTSLDVEKLRRRSGLVGSYSFENFIVGASNQFAHAACSAVANLPGDHYNPLFIYGGNGLGKTHLVHAIGNHILSQYPTKKILYLSSDSFMNELVTSLRRDRMEEFRKRFRNVEVLIVDDVQTLAGRERTQEEFFHTFNSLYERNLQIVLTSDRFPKEIPNLEERLCNRFEWGLIADVQSPDIETRTAILQKKAELDQIELSPEVALFLSSKITTNIRDLEGALTRLSALASIDNEELSLEFARQVLDRIVAENDSKITIESIQKTVCEYFGIRASDLRSKKRARNISLPRQVAMYLCRRYTDFSFPAIGDRFGGRDHSTVIHATQVIDQRMKQDSGFRARVEQLQRMLESCG